MVSKAYNEVIKEIEQARCRFIKKTNLKIPQRAFAQKKVLPVLRRALYDSK
jgi:hypothetical protein